MPRTIKQTGESAKNLGSPANPFVKWAGGKRKLFDLYANFFPASFNHYFEPFVGGGAVLFALLETKPAMNATIMDVNAELTNCYHVVKTRVAELIELLNGHKTRHAQEYYYQVRSWDRDANSYKKLSPVERAARLIYLNKTCFNGLYRVNSKGFFNVPFGKYDDPLICDEGNLQAASRTLQNVDIRTESFEEVLNYAQEGDFVYFDPPYQPISVTANFTSYTADNFGAGSQRRLREVFEILDARGCYVALSNSADKFIESLYASMPGIRVEIIPASRAINRDATKRGKIPEILILGKTLVKGKS